MIYDELRNVVETIGRLDFLNGNSNALLKVINAPDNDNPSLFSELLNNPNIMESLSSDERDDIMRTYNDSYINSSRPDPSIPKIALLQLAYTEDNRVKKNKSLDSLKTPPDVSDYDLIFCDVYPNSHASRLNQLNFIYDEYNSDKPRPSTYYGHSISVSDIIVLRNSKGFSSYYVNGSGFQRLDGFLNDMVRAKIDAFMDIREEYAMLESLSQKGISNDFSSERLSYIRHEYTQIFKLADQRSVLEKQEKELGISNVEGVKSNDSSIKDDSNSIVTHGEEHKAFEKNRVIAQKILLFFSGIDSSYEKTHGGTEFIERQLNDGNAKKYIGDLNEYKNRFSGHLSDSVVKEIDFILNDLEAMAKEDVEVKEKSPKDIVMERFRNGIKEVMSSDRFHDWCMTSGKFYLNNYSFRNAMLTYIQKPESSYVMGFEAWKGFGRQVKSGAKGISILAPTFISEPGKKGSLLSSIVKNMNAQFKKDPNLDCATFKLWKSNLTFNMYRNGLFDVMVNDKITMGNVPRETVRKFLDNSVIGKVPAYFKAVTVFDVSDVTPNIDTLWVKNGFKKSELVLDEEGNPIKNQKGAYKIHNSDERRNRFVSELDIKIPENDTEKMEVLYDVLTKISIKKGVDVYIVPRKSDTTLKEGADGYYHRGTNSITLPSDLTPTKRVSILLHEMGHSDMHKELDKLKGELSKMNENDVAITKKLKEVQAEAVACMTAGNFGIETETSSFNYMASYSSGRDLKELEVSLDYIWQKSKALMRDIEKGLGEKGLNLKLEAVDLTPLSESEKMATVKSNKEFFINESQRYDSIMREALDDLDGISDQRQKTIIKEQVDLCREVAEKLSKFDMLTESFEKSNDRTEQNRLSIRMEAEKSKVLFLVNKFEALSGERISVALENEANFKSDMKERFTNNPLKFLKQFQSEQDGMKGLSLNELKIIAGSKYVSSQYRKYLGIDNNRFATGAIEHLKRMQEVQSSNQTFIEIGSCECWGGHSVFTPGTVLHPAHANKSFEEAEKQIRIFKRKADKNKDNYPNTRCTLTVYTPNEMGKLIALETKIEIGDGTQKNLTGHLRDVCKRGADKKAVLANYEASLKERPKVKVIVPSELKEDEHGHALFANDGITEKKEERKVMDMDEWKKEINEKRESIKDTNVVEQIELGGDGWS